jgi:modification methylase
MFLTGISAVASAPYPLELASRLVKMFSFVGDTVLDPFARTGTTLLAAAKLQRNSIGIEIEPRTAPWRNSDWSGN